MTGFDLTGARRLRRNAGTAFMGDTKGGPFDVPGDLAREWLRLPANPNGRPNSDVLKPWVNGMDLTRRPSGKWIVDFGWSMTEADTALYEEPFQHVREHVHPMRKQNRRESYRVHWWRHVEPRQGMWGALNGLTRAIATPTVAKHRLFVWLDSRVCPDHQLIVIARDDDTDARHPAQPVSRGVVAATWYESGRPATLHADHDLRDLPVPEGLSSDIPAANYANDPLAAAIAKAARRLVESRNRWLNPPEWVEWWMSRCQVIPSDRYPATRPQQRN